MKSTLRTVHRWISLSVATLWVLQALSGIFLVFHWELDDALVAGPARPLDLERFSRRLEVLELSSRPLDRVHLGDRGNAGPVRDHGRRRADR